MRNTIVLPLYLCLVVMVLTDASLYAQADPTVSIQGTLKDANGASVGDGSQMLIFRLYNQPSGGNAIWQESATTTVVGGIYSHKLGSVTPLDESDFDQTLYLGVTVGNFELSPRTELTYAPYALSVVTSQRVARQGCSGQVGDIKYSILPPNEFSLENGDCWVPMDGRAIAGTRLATNYGRGNVPDMSGLFIRASEYGGTDNDPGRQATTPAGTYQADDNKSHRHSTNGLRAADNAHTHTFKDYYTRENRGNNADAQPPFTQELGDNYREATEDSGGPKGYREVTTANSVHGHALTGTMELSGGEARPKNLNFYVYIRVD